MSNTLNRPNVLSNLSDQAPKTGERYQKVLDDISESVRNAFDGNLYNPKVDKHLSFCKYWIINHPKKLEEHIGSLFFLADKAKQRKDYETANILWGILFDYAIKDDNQSIIFEYEYTDIDDLKAPSEWFKDKEEIRQGNYHGLAVLKYNDYYLNIPAPLLSADALNMFLRFARPVERHTHMRQHALNIYRSFNDIKDILNITELERPFNGKLDTYITKQQQDELKGGIKENYYDQMMDQFKEQEQREKVKNK